MGTATITITTELQALPTACSLQASMNTIKRISTPTLGLLPLFRDVPVGEHTNLFVAKLRLCSHIFDFKNSTGSLKEKHIKKQTLSELVNFVSSGPMKITEFVMEEVIKMVAANLFRSLSHPVHANDRLENVDEDYEEKMLEPAWPHLQFVYEFFLFFISSADIGVNTASPYLDQKFILNLMDLFESEDSRERQYLKTVLHRIYGKFMVHRPFIRKTMTNIFNDFVFESERHQGIAEFLEVLGSIINGFAVPLKEEHKVFLYRALLPLHKAKGFDAYHRQLCYCMTQYIGKEMKLLEIIVRSLLKYWPHRNSHKESLFIGELEEILVFTQVETLGQCMVPLFRKMGRCLCSLHFQVAERAIFLCSNESIVNFIKPHRAILFPLIVPALESNIIGHWNRVIDDMKMNLRKQYLDMDLLLYQECRGSHNYIKPNLLGLNTDQMNWPNITEDTTPSGVTRQCSASSGMLLTPNDVQ